MFGSSSLCYKEREFDGRRLYNEKWRRLAKYSLDVAIVKSITDLNLYVHT